jgi:hypothetical protein
VRCPSRCLALWNCGAATTKHFCKEPPPTYETDPEFWSNCIHCTHTDMPRAVKPSWYDASMRDGERRIETAPKARIEQSDRPSHMVSAHLLWRECLPRAYCCLLCMLQWFEQFRRAAFAEVLAIMRAFVTHQLRLHSWRATVTTFTDPPSQ